MLKQLVNVCHVEGRTVTPWTPPNEFVEMVFGLRPVPETAGFAAVGDPGTRLLIGEQLAAMAFYGTAGDPVGLALSFSGFPFACSWQHPVAQLAPFLFFTLAVSREDLVHRIAKIRDDDEGTELRFDWSGSWRERDNAGVAALRGRYPMRAT